jgi:hypothetical protein
MTETQDVIIAELKKIIRDALIILKGGKSQSDGSRD